MQKRSKLTWNPGVSFCLPFHRRVAAGGRMSCRIPEQTYLHLYPHLP